VDVAHSIFSVLSALQRLPGKRRELFQSLIHQISHEDLSDSSVLLQQELFPLSPMQLQLVRLLLQLIKVCMGPEPGHHIFDAGGS